MPQLIFIYVNYYLFLLISSVSRCRNFA